ncbi:MAG: hypothetical protein JW716_00025 [Candidatus Aenigmarchaeota archaeon]|nr:hypothetical protein [Candidatus Aenigmarchaeota archaeon]
MEGSIKYVIHGISGLTGRPCYVAQGGFFHKNTYTETPTFEYERAKEIVNDLASRRFTEPYPQFGPRTCARLLKARLKMFGGKYGYGLPLKTEEAYIRKVSESNHGSWHLQNVFSVIPVLVDNDGRRVKEFKPIPYKQFMGSKNRSELKIRHLGGFARRLFEETNEKYNYHSYTS